MRDIILFFAAIVFLAISIFFFSISGDELYCGIVKYKIDATRYGKHSAHADPILVVAFEARNEEEPAFIYEIHPNWNTYMSVKEGQRVCFEIEHPDKRDYPVFGIISGFFAVVLFVVILIYRIED